jgi:CHAT domain-containing protein
MFSSSERSHAAAMHDYAQLGDCPGVRRSLARSGSLMVQIGTIGDAENDLEEAATLPCPALLAANQADPPDPSQQASQGRTEIATHSDHDALCRHPIDAGKLGGDNKMIVFDALLSLSDAFELEGESVRAQRCLDEARPYAFEAHARMRLADARGAVLLDRNDAAGARRSFEQALRIADVARVPAANEHRGAAQLGVVRATLMAGRPGDALGPAFKALQSSVARVDIEQTVASLRLVASAYRGSSRTLEAAHTLQVAAALTEAVPIDELDGEKRATYLATQHAVFAELLDLFASRAIAGDAFAWQAFETSERGRARSLRYAITQSTRDAASPLEAPPAARYQQLLRDVVRLTATEASVAPAKLIDALDSAARQRGSVAPPLDRALLTQTLKGLGATLVEYAVGSRDMFAFVLAENGIQVIRLGDRLEIASAAADLHDRLRNSEAPVSTVRAAGNRLARLVLWPLREQLTGKRIVFVPDDALHTIPLATLPWGAEPDSQLVLQQAQTSIAPSALFLTSVHVTGPLPGGSPRIALVGDPVFRMADWRRECVEGAAPPTRVAAHFDRALSDWAESLPRLPGTRAEVSMVAKLARQARPASHIETLLGCAAVANALRFAADSGADLLHIATHGRVDAQRPRLSALALTPDRTTTPATSSFGLLDILGLKLKSRLVVLSACDTSRGKLLPGEGVLGPAQAFLQAGSAAVLASYWRVDDEATASFMARFYGYLLVDHLAAADALRRAQLDTSRTSGPHDWAAFALYGWPDSSI